MKGAESCATSGRWHRSSGSSASSTCARDRRGVFELGPVVLGVGDLFAREAATEERRLVDHFLVRPRTVAAPIILEEDRWGGEDRAQAGLSEDPSRFAGVRRVRTRRSDPADPSPGECPARVGR